MYVYCCWLNLNERLVLVLIVIATYIIFNQSLIRTINQLYLRNIFEKFCSEIKVQEYTRYENISVELLYLSRTHTIVEIITLANTFP